MNKQLILYILLLCSLFMAIPKQVAATNFYENSTLLADYIDNPSENPCADKGILMIFKILGYIIFVAKILVPLLIMITGIIDFSKIIISQKPEEITKAAKTLAFRVIAGIIIFMLPTVIDTVIDLIPTSVTLIENSDTGEVTSEDKYGVCRDCLFHPGNC